MTRLIQRFSADEEGATAIEYALIAVIVAVGIIASLQPIPGALSAIFEAVAAALSSA
jgi:pilus assembly protein Flp/PilA